jgi:hypothetical protein
MRMSGKVGYAEHLNVHCSATIRCGGCWQGTSWTCLLLNTAGMSKDHPTPLYTTSPQYFHSFL